MIKAKFIERKNRFAALVEVAGEEVLAHVANSGRLRELLCPGAEVYLEDKRGAGRATLYDLALVKYKGMFVSVDARVPNRVIADAVNNGLLEEFKGCRVVKREIKYGESRLDLLLDSEGQKYYVEVKSVTLVVDGTARFPDAPTERGARHLNELVRACSEGNKAAVVFLIQREDAAVFSPNDTTDPAFGAALRNAFHNGVNVFAYICKINLKGTEIIKRIPTIL